MTTGESSPRERHPPRHYEGVPGVLAHASPIPAAVRAAGLLFLSAVRGVDAGTGACPDDPRRQAEVALDNLEKVLTGCGSALSRVVAVTVYMRDLQAHRPVFNDVWRDRFGERSPARSAVQVTDLGPGDGGTLFLLSAVAEAGE